jgi:hypothetical protein
MIIENYLETKYPEAVELPYLTVSRLEIEERLVEILEEFQAGDLSISHARDQVMAVINDCQEEGLQ